MSWRSSEKENMLSKVAIHEVGLPHCKIGNPFQIKIVGGDIANIKQQPWNFETAARNCKEANMVCSCNEKFNCFTKLEVKLMQNKKAHKKLIYS